MAKLTTEDTPKRR